jgi:Ca-activated chloride channel family protein
LERSIVTAGGTGEDERWRDAGFWLVPVVALISLMWFRPGWTVQWVLLLCCLWGMTAPAVADQGNPDAEAKRAAGRAANWWFTPDQQGMRLYRHDEFAEAARRFIDPMWRGSAFYRDGQFEAAAAAFARVDTAESNYNRGNALLMLGRYDDAITAYDRALSFRPGWPEAAANRKIAELRKARLAPAEDDHGGTGGMLEADEIVLGEPGKGKGDS